MVVNPAYTFVTCLTVDQYSLANAGEIAERAPAVPNTAETYAAQQALLERAIAGNPAHEGSGS